MNINKVIIAGTIKEVDANKTKAGKAVVNLTIVTEEFYNSGGEQKVSRCDHKIVLFGQPAEFAEKYAKPGSPAYVEGSIRNRDWVNKEGKTMYSKEIIAKEFKLLDDKGLQEEKKSLNY